MVIDPHNTEGAPPRRVTVEEKKGRKWWLWALLLLLLALLLFALSRCNRTETATTNITDSVTNTIGNSAEVAGAAGGSTPPTAIEKVTLPGGKVIDLEPASLGFQLQSFLASDALTPRTFTFDKLNFATGSAAIREEDRPTIAAIIAILTAYPKAKVELVGFADPRGDASRNAVLAASRAKAVAAALTSAGIAADRVSSKGAGETSPADPNTKADTLQEARRTDLTVTAK